jgi:hypothetical protein
MVHVPLRQRPFVEVVETVFAPRREFRPLFRLHIVDPLERAIRPEHGVEHAHFDRIIEERARRLASDQGRMNDGKLLSFGDDWRGRRQFHFEVEPAPMFTAECGNLGTLLRDPSRAAFGGSMRSKCFPLCATSSATATAPDFVKPAGIWPTGVLSKSSERISVGVEGIERWRQLKPSQRLLTGCGERGRAWTGDNRKLCPLRPNFERHFGSRLSSHGELLQICTLPFPSF